MDVYSIRQPLGSWPASPRFNFPAMVPMWMYPNAIACGNTFVLKPSEKDPSAPLFTMELLAEAGLPPGVVNLVQGDKVAVDRLLEHPDVVAVSFVGSTPVARAIYETGTRNGKRVAGAGRCQEPHDRPPRRRPGSRRRRRRQRRLRLRRRALHGHLRGRGRWRGGRPAGGRHRCAPRQDPHRRRPGRPRRRDGSADHR